MAAGHRFALSNSSPHFNRSPRKRLRSSPAFSFLPLLTAAPRRALSAAMPDSSRPQRPRVIVPRQLMPHVEARMAALFDVPLLAPNRPFTPDALTPDVPDSPA